MSKNGVIAVCLFFSLVANAFLLKTYFDDKQTQRALEKGIVMNEFIEREKGLRNFRAFVGELAAKGDKYVPVSEEQANLYWLLASPSRSAISKGTDLMQADYEQFDNHITFIREFDKEYEAISDLFKSKLPLMTKEQLTAFSSRFNETYDLLKDKALRDWKISRTDTKVDIRFEPPKEILNQVLQELISIHAELEALN